MTGLLPEERQKLATDWSNQWIAEQVEKSDENMGNTRAPLQGASAAASVSGLTFEEAEAGRLTNRDEDTAAAEVDVELEEAPRDEPGSRNKVMTPERPAAVRRPDDYDRDVGKSRGRIDDDDGDAAADNDGATTCSMPSDDADQMLDSLDEIDRRILASIIMSVDVTEVFSPARVNKLAAKFGLTPGASLDLRNGWDFSLASDRNRAWKLVKYADPVGYHRFSPVHIVQ